MTAYIVIYDIPLCVYEYFSILTLYIYGLSKTPGLTPGLNPASPKYTWYGEIGTAIVRRYQKSGSASGTLDINIWGQMGHKSPYSNDTVFNKISAILIFVSNATTYQRIEIQDMLNNAYLGPPIFICKIDFYAE